MKVKELIQALSKFDGEMTVAGYSEYGECDFPIENVAVSDTDEYGPVDYYNEGETYFSECGEIVVISGGSR